MIEDHPEIRCAACGERQGDHYHVVYSACSAASFVPVHSAATPRGPYLGTESRGSHGPGSYAGVVTGCQCDACQTGPFKGPADDATAVRCLCEWTPAFGTLQRVSEDCRVHYWKARLAADKSSGELPSRGRAIDDKRCVCGHTARQHIYYEGACRPGYRCREECQEFRSAVDEASAP